MAVERHLGFQAQCVARAKTAGANTELLAGIEHSAPHALGLLGRDVDLEAVFAGVAGASDARRTPRPPRRRRTSNSGWRPDPRGVSFCSVASAFGPWMASWAYRSLANSTFGDRAVHRGDVVEILLLVGGVHAQEVMVADRLCGPGCRRRTRRARTAGPSTAPARS